MGFGQHAGGKPLDRAEGFVLFIVPFLISQPLGVGFEDLGARVAQGIHSVAHAVDQPASVAGLLADNPGQQGAQFAFILRVFDIFQNIVKLAHDLEVRAAVLGAFERADRRRDRGISIGARA